MVLAVRAADPGCDGCARGSAVVDAEGGADGGVGGLFKKAGSLRNPRSLISRKIGDRILAVCTEVEAHAAVMMFDELAGLPRVSVTVDWPFAFPIRDNPTGTVPS